MTDTSTQPDPLEIPSLPGGEKDVLSIKSPPKNRKFGDWKWLDNRPGRIVKYCCYRAFRLFGEFAAIILGLALFWVTALNVVLARGSVDVSFLDKNAGLWFSQAFDGQDASVGKMTLDWSPAGNSVVFTANNISVTDEQAREVQHINTLSSEVGIARVLFGQLDARRLNIVGGAVTWRRGVDGAVKAGLGTPETIGKLGPVWTGQVAKRRERGVFSLGGLEEVTITDAVAYVQDDRDGLSLEFSDTFIDIQNVGDVFEFKGKTNIIIGEDGADLKADLVLSPDFQDFDLRVTGQSLNPKALAPQRGRLAALKNLNALMDFDLQINAARDVGLNHVQANLTAGRGEASLGAFKLDFNNAKLAAEYDPITEALKFTELSMVSDKVDVTGEASMRNLGTPANGFLKEPADFVLNLSKFKADITPLFDQPFDLASVKVAGRYNYADLQMDYSKIALDFGEFQTDLSGIVRRNWDGGFDRIKLDGRINGLMTPEDLLSIWPAKFALGARKWIDRAILKADLTDLELRLDIPKDALKSGTLLNEHLDLSFKVANADVKYISTMTPLTQAAGIGRLRGNAFELISDQGKVGALSIDRGAVNIPRLNPKGGDLLIDIDGHGDTAEMMGLIDQKPFEFAKRYGVDPAKFGGKGKINLKIQRPLLEYFDQNRIEYSVAGTFEDVSAPFAIGPHKVTNGNVTLQSDKAGLHVKGPINIGPWKTNLDWREIFDNGATPSMFKVSGLLTRDDLDAFGIGFREYFMGDIKLTVDARGNGIAITNADIVGDLTQTDIQVGSYWDKPSGVPGSFTGTLSRSEAGAIAVKNMQADAPGMTIRGDLDLAANMRLLNLDLRETKIENFVDARLQAKPDNDKFSVFLTGDYLDISPFVSRSISTQSSSDMDVPVLLTAALEKLALKPDYVLGGANILFAHDGVGISQARLRGVAKEGPFTFEVTTNDAARVREIMVDVPDASVAANAFFGLDNIKGGRLKVEAGMPLTGDLGPMQGMAEIDEFILVKAPALAQMLSMASLQGLGDTLGGTGISFDRFEVPFSFNQGELNIRDARVSGPAIGLTGDGDVNFSTKALDFDGVLVPAYSANSILGGIPLIGDLMVGKKGEGIFALSYTVKGSFDQTQIVVNPLSALTPGFLRGIFKPSRKGMHDAELINQIEAVKPKPGDKN